MKQSMRLGCPCACVQRSDQKLNQPTAAAPPPPPERMVHYTHLIPSEVLIEYVVSHRLLISSSSFGS